MSSLSLSVAVASAKAASEQALQALAGLAEVLGTPKAVALALAEAKAKLAGAEEALAGLVAAIEAAMATATAMAAATAGIDAKGLYQLLGTVAEASAAELERQLSRNRRCRGRLRMIRTIALVLMLLCALPLSLDVVREVLGVTQESHVLFSLATVTIASQVALWGAGTSKHHLATAASHQRHQALRYRRLARDVTAAAAATTEANEAIKDANATMGMLEEVADHLRSVVDAVTQDLEMAQGFPASARALGDAVVALGTGIGGNEGTQRLAQALEGLPWDE